MFKLFSAFSGNHPVLEVPNIRKLGRKKFAVIETGGCKNNHVESYCPRFGGRAVKGVNKCDRRTWDRIQANILFSS